MSRTKRATGVDALLLLIMLSTATGIVLTNCFPGEKSSLDVSAVAIVIDYSRSPTKEELRIVKVNDKTYSASTWFIPKGNKKTRIRKSDLGMANLSRREGQAFFASMSLDTFVATSSRVEKCGNFLEGFSVNPPFWTTGATAESLPDNRIFIKYVVGREIYSAEGPMTANGKCLKATMSLAKLLFNETHVRSGEAESGI